MEVNDRIKQILQHYKLTITAFSNRLGFDNNGTVSNLIGGRKSKPSFDLLVKIIDAFPDVREKWLLKGEGVMLYSEGAKNIDTQSSLEIEYFENNHSNEFIKLDNGQYLMTMPLAEFDVQAGFLDLYQDDEYIQTLSKHSILVDKKAFGKYVAFRVKGDSMDSGKSDAIQHNSIVTTRELQRVHWTNKLRFKDFPYWVIFTAESRYPLIKEIINHDTETGIITCHSLNDGPEFVDFNLHVNSIQALFYVVDITKPVSSQDY